MDRRHLLAGLAGLPFATAAFAQMAQPQSPAAQTGGAAGGVYGTAGVTNANTGAPGLGQAEQQWLQQTMMVGSVALQTSEIALQKAQDEDVKQFAKFEADEQKGLAEVLRSMLEPAGTASPQGAAGAAPQPDQKHAAMIQKLQQEKAGDAFDKDYVKGQLEGHRELLADPGALHPGTLAEPRGHERRKARRRPYPRAHPGARGSSGLTPREWSGTMAVFHARALS